MLKHLENLIVNFMIFWVLVTTMPGVSSPNGSFGYVLVGLIYGLFIVVLPEILRFFRFPKNVWGKLLIGSGITFVVLLLISSILPDVMTFTSGFVGGFDFIWFTTPRLLDLQSKIAVIGFVSVLLNICSIILQFLNKGRF